MTHAQGMFPFGNKILQFCFLIVYNCLMFGLKERKEKYKKKKISKPFLPQVKTITEQKINKGQAFTLKN